MKQADIDARKSISEIVNDDALSVTIPGTNKVVKIRGVKPFTMERLTKLWLMRDDMSRLDDSASTLKSMCSEPYFAIQEALLFVLNDWLKIILFHKLLTFWWGKVRGYTDSQMFPIIEAGKKKVQLSAHWMVMAYSTDMRMDIVGMTKKEAEQYRAELISAANQLSLKNTQVTEG